MEHACHIEGIGTLQNLEFLDISDTELDRLPKTISNLKKLQWLKMNNTSVRMWINDTDWTRLTELEVLEARDSEDYGVSMRTIFMLPSLKKLYTDRSKIDMDVYSRSLKRYVLEEWSASEIKYLPDEIMRKLPKLRTWNLSHNLLTYLPKKIGKLKSLEVLDLSYNKLSKLPKSLKRLKRLKTLNLEGNLLDEATLDWLKSVLPGDCKLIF
ncbi:MAG: hypothetical protein GY810_25945 [Aureispira sp.]|nr:hypothetical protein [Aureispira sp.]